MVRPPYWPYLAIHIRKSNTRRLRRRCGLEVRRRTIEDGTECVSEERQNRRYRQGNQNQEQRVLGQILTFFHTP